MSASSASPVWLCRANVQSSAEPVCEVLQLLVTPTVPLGVDVPDITSSPSCGDPVERYRAEPASAPGRTGYGEPCAGRALDGAADRDRRMPHPGAAGVAGGIGAAGRTQANVNRRAPDRQAGLGAGDPLSDQPDGRGRRVPARPALLRLEVPA